MRNRERIVISGPARNRRVISPSSPAKTCQHRGPQIRTMTSDLCGQRGHNLPVYACELHGECTHGQVCRGQDPSVRVCLTCDDGPWAF